MGYCPVCVKLHSGPNKAHYSMLIPFNTKIMLA